MANLNWERIVARYRLAIGEGAGADELFRPFGAPLEEAARISAEELKAVLEDDDDGRPVLLDLCLPRDLPRRRDMLAGASMHAPAALPHWIEELPRDRPIAVYCICGFQVSGAAVTELRQRGYKARASLAGLLPGMQLVAPRCRSIPLHGRECHKRGEQDTPTSRKQQAGWLAGSLKAI
jgi:Fe-Mn family superoxide dismutase